MIGGIVGYNFADIIKNVNYGEVNIEDKTSTGGFYIGGISGYNARKQAALIKNVNYGEINADANDAYVYSGGITGTNSGTVKQCVNYKTGNISATSINNNVLVGGVAAFNTYSYQTGIIDSSYNMASIFGTGSGTNKSKIGGITGSNKGGTITNSYVVGNVSGYGEDVMVVVGGITGGINENATISNSYYLNVISNNIYGMIEGVNTITPEILVKTESEMKSSAFVNLLNAELDEAVWVMDTEGINDGYPILSFER